VEVLALILRKVHKFPILHKAYKSMLFMVFIVELYFSVEDWRMWNLLRGYGDISLCGFLYGLESVEIVLSAFGGVNIILL
jgi:hypothetical protein